MQKEKDSSYTNMLKEWHQQFYTQYDWPTDYIASDLSTWYLSIVDRCADVIQNYNGNMDEIIGNQGVAADGKCILGWAPESQAKAIALVESIMTPENLALCKAPLTLDHFNTIMAKVGALSKETPEYVWWHCCFDIIVDASKSYTPSSPIEDVTL